MIIRRITAELLRAGPRHNQLLSPLTQYLGVCEDSPAGVVTLPYEHAAFNRRLRELRYTIAAEKDPGRRGGILSQTGDEIARVLGSIPGLSGGLTGERGRPELLTHLRLVISASELALLPFELSKMPVGTGASPDNWLVLQAHAPVCITRHNRSVRSEGVRWAKRPRILFVSGPDVPHDAHLEALRKSFKPFLDERGENRWLTVLEDAGIDAILEECARTEFTHVHFLAHGAEVPDAPGSFGLSLGDDVCSGRSLATALTSVGPDRVHRPTVVTLATCDSGQEGDVITADASIAHDLHEAGIPLVVASQFPLSILGSVPFVETFYADLLRGDHPLKSLYQVRLDLFSLFGQEFHDWASLVVYEALPTDLHEQLQELRYEQTNRALMVALANLEKKVRQVALSYEDYENWRAPVFRALEQLPREGPYAAECIGLRAAARKRFAEVAYRQYMLSDEPAEVRDSYLRDCRTNLREALLSYREAVKTFLVNPDGLVHRKASMHWVLCQMLSVSLILGRRLDMEGWMTARKSATTEIEHAGRDERAWAHGTMSELSLLRLAEPGLDINERAEFATEAVEHVRKVVEIKGLESFPVKSTARQINRYLSCWGDPAFAEALEELKIPSKKHWSGKHGLLETAEKIVQALGEEPAQPAEAATKAAKRRKKPAKASKKPSTNPDRAEKSAKSVAKDKPKDKDKPKAARAATRTGQLSSSPPAESAPEDPVFDINMLPARNGDCLWIEYGSNAKRRRILIDCGAKSAAKVLKTRIEALPEDQRFFELFMLTHIDADHISGVVPFFSNLSPGVAFEDLWYNGWEQMPRHLLGFKQAEDFTALIKKNGFPWNRAVTGEDKKRPNAIVVPDDEALPTFTLRDGLKLTLLSPGFHELADLAKKWKEWGLKELDPAEAQKFLGRKPKPKPVTDFKKFDLEALVKKPPPKDPSVANGSSIAVLAEFGGRSVLLTGDAHAEVLAKSIKTLLKERGIEGGKLKLDAMKLSHHGSTNAMTDELLEVLDCPRYLVCSNGSRFYHPDRPAIARVILHGGDNPTLLFNYRSEFNGLWDEQVLKDRYNYQTVFPEKKNKGLLVSL